MNVREEFYVKSISNTVYYCICPSKKIVERAFDKSYVDAKNL